METGFLNRLSAELSELQERSNLRVLPLVTHRGREIEVKGRRMLNLSSNDYLGLSADTVLKKEFLETLTVDSFLPSSSSSRLLTGNFRINEELEELLASLYGAESALVFNSGYHMNMGILPAVCYSRTLILADKLVHASIIDGLRLSTARFMRYPHNDYETLESLLKKQSSVYETVIIATESIFSMDGDEADLKRLVELKKKYPNVMLYVDEAHATGVRGPGGLGCAEEQDCMGEIDFLVGTFGKALASVGGYLVCRKVIRDYLVNKMRTLIFTTALPPLNSLWTKFVLERLDTLASRRTHLIALGNKLSAALTRENRECSSTSHIIPMITGESHVALAKAEELQQRGFYVLPVRPPTVPEGTSRIRFSLTASMTEKEMEQLIIAIR